MTLRGRQTGKTDRRTGPVGSDRRASRRRLGDKVNAHLHDNEEVRRRKALARELRGWATSKLIKRLAANAYLDHHWENDLIAAELDARLPPRSS